MNHFKLELKRDSNTKSQDKEYFYLNLDNTRNIQFLSYEKEYGEKEGAGKIILEVDGHQFPFLQFTQESILRLRDFLDTQL